MSGKLFIERRDKEGDYAIRRPNADRISDHEATQAEAIERAREIDRNAAILVERVRNTDRGNPDKWRRP
jgi:pyridoxine/pyridoxamine 5'-phosphate oxidase